MFVLCSIKVLSDPKLSHIYISKALYKVFIHLHTHTHTPMQPLTLGFIVFATDTAKALMIKLPAL